MDTTKLIRQFYGLLSATGLKEMKDAMITPFGVVSSKDLSAAQLETLCARLQVILDAKNAPSRELRAARSIVLKLAQELGVWQNNGDWAKFNKWMMDSRVMGKLLYECDVAELSALAVKVRAILGKDKKKRAAEDWVARNN
jgi:hypothetical protein